MNKQVNAGSPSKKRILYTRCCDGNATSDELHEMYDVERDITYRTFAKHVDIGPVAAALQYAVGRNEKGLRLHQDWHVRYYRSTFRGQPCYYMDHSAIDHIFVFPEQFQKLDS